MNTPIELLRELAALKRYGKNGHPNRSENLFTVNVPTELFERVDAALSVALLPCPHCGEQPDLVDFSCQGIAWQVLCTGCAAQTGEYDNESVPTDIWNRRTAPPATSGEWLTLAEIKEAWQSANGECLESNEFGAMVVDFARTLLRASDSATASEK